jgi:hypothetical protein
VLDSAAALADSARDDERVSVGALFVNENDTDSESEKDGADVLLPMDAVVVGVGVAI